MKLLAPVVLTALLLAAPTAYAQSNALSVEARGGITLAAGDFGDGAQSGFAFDATLGYRVVPVLGVYAGYSHDDFGCDKSLGHGCNRHSQGFEVGARVELPNVRLKPWARGGVIYHELDRSVTPQGVPVKLRSELALGYEIGGGVAFPLTSTFAITPGVRYRAYGTDFGDPFGTGSIQIDVRYFVADIGLRYSFRL